MEHSLLARPIETRSWIQQVPPALVMAVLYAAPVLFVLRLDQVNDTDVWWHLRVGQWIAQHRTIPHSELFSAFAAGKSWSAYSWLFELTLFSLFQKLGLVGIAIYSSTMVAAIAAALHHLVRRLNSDLALGAGLTFLAMYTMGRLYAPRPWLITILFFTLELNILMQARKNDRTRELLWLPLIFAFWANVHIQFVDGLVVLGIALIESVLARWWPGMATKLSPRKAVCVFLGCIAATLINPSGWGIYRVAYGLVAQTGQISQISELSAIAFRSLDDWFVLLFALASVAALAWAHRVTFFEAMLLAFSIVIALRSQRDVWVIAVSASAILASSLHWNGEKAYRPGLPTIPIVLLATGLLGVLAFRLMRFDNADLQIKLAADLPERAVEIIKQKNMKGPLFNDLNWGGYLIWSLRMPVSIDGRTNVYGSQRIVRSYQTWNAYPGWDSDPDLLPAELIFAKSSAPLTQVLRLQPCLQVAYEDGLAALFIANPNETSAPDRAATTFCTSRALPTGQQASHR